MTFTTKLLYSGIRCFNGGLKTRALILFHLLEIVKNNQTINVFTATAQLDIYYLAVGGDFPFYYSGDYLQRSHGIADILGDIIDYSAIRFI
jgi:hypothetical protein